MKKRLLKAVAAVAAGACMICPTGAAFVVPMTSYAADILINDTIDGYDYQLWQTHYEGKADYEHLENNGFNFSWEDVESAYFDKGFVFKNKYPGETIYADQLKDYYIEYDADTDLNGSDSVCIYGWMQDQLVEFFIYEGWGLWEPPGSGIKRILTYESEGRTYDLYMRRKNTGFDFNMEQVTQYISVPKDNKCVVGEKAHLEGKVRFDDHVNAWKEAGLSIGPMYSISLEVNAFKSSGSVTVNSLEIHGDIADERPADATVTTPTEPTPEPTTDPYNWQKDEQGVYKTFDFESDPGSFKGTDLMPASLGRSGENTFVNATAESGKRALYLDLDKMDLKKGKYSFSFDVRQDSGERINMVASLEELDTSLSKEYRTVDIIAEGSARSGRWSTISNNSFDYAPNDFDKRKYRLCITTANDFDDTDFSLDNIRISEAFIKGLASIENAAPREANADLNGDDKVDVFDIIKCRKALVESLSADALNIEGDVDGDCLTSVNDLVILSKLVMGSANSIPESSSKAYYLTNGLSQDINGHSVRMYNDYTGNGTQMAAREDGTFFCSWENDRKAYFESGLSSKGYVFNENQNDLKLEYAASVTVKGEATVGLSGDMITSVSSIPTNVTLPGVVKFHVIDGWTGERPFSGKEAAATIEVDGEEYDIYTDNAPVEYWSVRKNNCLEEDKNTQIEGTISLDPHIKAWRAAYPQFNVGDAKLGTLSFRLNVNKGTGFADVTNAKITGIGEKE